MRGLLLDNLPQKGFALVMAFALVWFVHEDKVSQATATVRVRLGLPDERILVSPTVDKVSVVIEGKYSALRKLDLERLQPILLNLSGNEGDQITFEPEMVRLPHGLTVKSVRPAAMVVRFEARIEKKVPVVVKTEGEPALGFRVTQLAVEPPEVQITGAESVIETLTKVETAGGELAGRSRSADLLIPLRLPPAFVQYVGPEKFKVSLVIEEGRGTRVVGGRPVQTRGTSAMGPTFEVSPPTVDVTLHGPATLLEALDPETLHPFVDTRGLEAGRRVLYTRAVSVDPPAGLTVVEVKPGKVALLRSSQGPAPATTP